MKRILFVLAITILLVPIYYPLYGQDGGFGGGDSVDITGILGDRGGGRGGFNGNNGRGAILLPESKALFSDIQSALKKGKTPLDKSQERTPSKYAGPGSRQSQRSRSTAPSE